MADQVTRLVLLEAKTKGVKEATKEFEELSDAEKQVILDNEELVEEQEEAAKAFDETAGSVKIFGVNLKAAFKGAVQTIRNVVTGFKTLKGAIAATGIGLILIAFASLAALLKTNQGAINFLSDAMKVLGAVVNELVTRFGKLASALIKVIKLDFSGAVDDVKDAFTGLGESISNAVGETLRLEKAQRALEDQQRITLLLNAQEQRDIKELVLLSRDRDLSAQQRQKAILEAQVLQENINARNIADAEEEQRILKDNIALATQSRGIKDTEKDELIAAQIEVLRAQELAADGLRDLVNRQFELDQAVNAERAEAAELERLRNFESIEFGKERNKLIAEEIKGLEKLNLKRREVTTNAQEGAEAEIAITKEKNEVIAQNTADLFGGLAALAGQNSVFGKAAAVAQATINTFQGASKAIADGGVAGVIAAVAVIAAGLANVRRILEVPLPQVQVIESSFGEGGILNGRSHRHGGIRAGGVEFEGGEAIINKRSTAMFRDVLSNINFAGGGKKFQTGGITPRVFNIPRIDTEFQAQQFEQLQRAVREQQVVAIVEDITNLQTQIDVREDRANLG